MTTTPNKEEVAERKRLELIRELGERAIRAIERAEDVCFDICAETGQIFDNVKHTRWFRMEVARWFSYNVKRFNNLLQ